MKKEKVIIKNQTGLHARPASELAQLANKFKSDINLIIGEKKINAKSILGIMSAGIKEKTEIEIECNGDDEDIAITQLVDAINNKLGE